MIPTIKDLVMYVNKALDSVAWNTNWQKVVNWLTSGNYDIKVKNLEISEGGGITNNGDLTQNGNLTVNGNLEAEEIKANFFEGDGSKLYNLVTQGVQAFTPFCINKGYFHDGYADLITRTPVTEGSNIVRFDINFKVDSGTTFGKIKATTAGGTTFELEQLNSDVLATNGTFYYFISQGEEVVTRLSNITIYRQSKTPSDNTINNVWLDTSGEELVCKKLSEAGVWEKWDYVPLGKVVIENIGTASATSSGETFLYNWNGYNIVIPDCQNLQTNQYPRVVVKTWTSGTDWYRLYSDGWVEQGGRSIGNSSLNVNLHIAMKDTNYFAMAVNLKSGAYEAVTVARNDYPASITTTYFYVGQSSHNDGSFIWEAKGYSNLA